jgi:hypothetical protein
MTHEIGVLLVVAALLSSAGFARTAPRYRQVAPIRQRRDYDAATTMLSSGNTG